MLLTLETWRRLGGTLLGEAVVCGQKELSPEVTAAHQSPHPASCEGESNTEMGLSPPAPQRDCSSQNHEPHEESPCQCPSLYQNLSHIPPRMAKTPHCHWGFPLQAAELPKAITVSRAISWVFGMVTVTLWPSSTGPVPQFMHLSLISHLKNTVQFPAVI